MQFLLKAAWYGWVWSVWSLFIFFSPRGNQRIKRLLLELIYVLHPLYRAFCPLGSVLQFRGSFFFSPWIFYETVMGFVLFTGDYTYKSKM